MTDHYAAEALPHHRSRTELLNGLANVREAPSDEGALALIVRRPDNGAREVLEAGELTLEEGLVGDNWSRRFSKRTADGSPHPEMQLTVMNARATALFAGEREHWPLAGDQLYVNLNLSEPNITPGARLAIGGTAIIEVTSMPHRGCDKFGRRFGAEAMRLVSHEDWGRLNLRGVNARVVVPGMIREGDVVCRQMR